MAEAAEQESAKTEEKKDPKLVMKVIQIYDNEDLGRIVFTARTQWNDRR